MMTNVRWKFQLNIEADNFNRLRRNFVYTFSLDANFMISKMKNYNKND